MGQARLFSYDDIAPDNTVPYNTVVGTKTGVSAVVYTYHDEHEEKVGKVGNIGNFKVSERAQGGN